MIFLVVLELIVLDTNCGLQNNNHYIVIYSVSNSYFFVFLYFVFIIFLSF